MPDSTPSKSSPGTTVASSNQPTQAQATRRGHGATFQASSLVNVPIPTLSVEAAKVLQNRKTKQAGMIRGPGSVGGGKANRMAGVQVVRAAPKVFSPLYENSNLQLPRDLRTLNAWCRHFYNINPLVRNAINLHATYPISKFNLECEDKKILHFFEDMFEQLNMPNILHAISLEYWKLGEAIVQAELDPNNGVWQHLFCFHPETEITLADHLSIPISELKVGMQVVTHTGAIKKVINTMSREYDGAMYSFYSLSNTPITVTKDHDLLVVSNNILKDDLILGRGSEYYIPVSDDISPKITFAQDVKDGDFFAIPKVSVNDKPENLPIEKALFWGHFLSEGTVGYHYIKKTKVRAPYYISIAVQKDESAFLKQIEDSANASYPAFVRDRGKKAHQKLPAWSIRPQYYYHNCEKTHKLTEVVTGSISIISEIIEKTSVKGSTKAENKRIPFEIFKAGNREKLAFLLAYLNGDGAVQQRSSEDGCTLSYSTSSPNLCVGLVFLLHSFDLIPVVDKYQKPSKTAKHPSYRICLNHCDTIRFKQLIQKNDLMIYNIGKLDIIETERSLTSDSRNRIYFNKNFFFTKIRKITQEHYRGMVHNCTVEEDHSLPVHPNGIVSSQCHNPDYIRVQISPLAKDPIITLIPDEHLKRIVTSSAASDAELKRQLPPEIIALIQNGLDIPLNNFNVSHLKMLSSDYDVRGSSIISACYKDLMLYDKLREAEFVQADDMVNPITHVKLGDPNGCYSEDTEILTENGFKKYSEVQVGEKLATFNSVSETIEYQDYTDPVVYYYDSAEHGEMYHFISKEIDAFVTPNHNMFVNENTLIQAKDLTDKIVDFLAIVELDSQKIELSTLKRFEFEMKNLQKVSYKGYVWCFSVPNRILITRRNGIIAIQGNSWKPDDTDISDMRQAFEEAMYDLDFKLVTHGAVTIEKIGNGGAVLDTSRMWDQINKNILIGLMAPEEIINGNGASYASATVGLEVLRSRYERFRNTIDVWTRRKIMEPIAKIQDFYTWEHGRRRLIVPNIVWNKMNLRDVESYLQNLTGLVGDTPGTGRISARTLFNILDIDPDSQITETRRELIEAAVRAKEQMALAKMSVEELLTLDHNKPITDKHPTASPSADQSIPGETDEGGGGDGGLGDLGLGGLGGGGGGGAPPGLGDLGLGDLGGGPPEGGPSEGAPTPDLGGLGG